MNRPLGRRLSEMIGEGAQIPPAADMLYRGGPVVTAGDSVTLRLARGARIIGIDLNQPLPPGPPGPASPIR